MRGLTMPGQKAETSNHYELLELSHEVVFSNIQSDLQSGEVSQKINVTSDTLFQVKLYTLTFWYRGIIIFKKKLRGLSPRANYTDRAAAAGRRS